MVQKISCMKKQRDEKTQIIFVLQNQKEKAKKTKMAKKKLFNQTLVEMVFKISGFTLSKKWKGRLNNR